jgi:K+-transporting ATPase A subunit
MTPNGWLQIGVTLSLVLLAAIPLGIYVSRLVSGERTFMEYAREAASSAVSIGLPAWMRRKSRAGLPTASRR